MCISFLFIPKNTQINYDWIHFRRKPILSFVPYKSIIVIINLVRAPEKFFSIKLTGEDGEKYGSCLFDAIYNTTPYHIIYSHRIS